MDVNRSNASGSREAQQRYREAMVELVRRTRSSLQDARQEVVQGGRERAAVRTNESVQPREVETSPADQRRDRVDISEDSLARMRPILGGEESDTQRPKIERLKQAYQNGRLNSPERFELAAQRMLQGAIEAPVEATSGSDPSSNDVTSDQ